MTVVTTVVTRGLFSRLLGCYACYFYAITRQNNTKVGQFSAKNYDHVPENALQEATGCFHVVL